MTTVRVAVASTPSMATLADAVPAVITAVTAAVRARAAIVCVPETCLPGHRSQARRIPAYDADELAGAVATVLDVARRAGIAAIVSAEHPIAAGREIVAHVVGADGERLGTQAKTQIDPSEERDYVPGSGRRVFTTAGLTFAVVTCHEAYRYPELSRQATLAGAQVLFVPHHVVTDDGSLATEWCSPSHPYNEQALRCRAIENTVYVATANTAGPEQGSATCILSPHGDLITQVPYGEVGVAVADLDLAAATGLIAHRWAPERNRM